MRRVSYTRALPVFFALGVMAMAVINTVLLPQPASAYDASEQGAKDFANYWCGGGSGWGETAMADYMWITNPNTGGLSFDVVEGGDQTVPVKVNFFVTYCKTWPNDTTAKGYDLGVSQSGGPNLLRNAPPEVKYGDRTKWLQKERETWGPSQYDARLDLTGLKTGDYWMCTSFVSYSVHSVNTVPSDSACFTVHVNRSYPWATDGQSFVGVNHTPNVSEWDATPGQTVTWNHRVWNTTAYGTSQIKPAVERSGFRASSGLNGNQYPWSGAQFSLGAWADYWLGNATANYNEDKYFKYVIDQDDVGAGSTKPKICQFVSWGPWRQGSGEWKGTSDNPACVKVPYNFSLVPSVAGIGGAVEPGATIDVDPSVKNNGPTKSYDDTKWELNRFIATSLSDIRPSAKTAQKPCDYYGNGCQPATPGSSGQRSFPESPNNTPVGTLTNYAVPDADLGSWLCFALSVQPYIPGSGDWYHGTPSCVKIGKKPKVQIQGHDVAVRGTIDTSTTTKDTSTFGSWVEYGAFSTGPNNRFASGAGLVNQPSSSQNAWSALTFANKGVPVSCGTHGCYTTPANFRPLPGIAAYFNSMQAADYDSSASLDANSVATGGPITVKKQTGDLTLGGGSLSHGRTLVIMATGTVTITGDLTYADGPMTNLTELPQLVIIAKNIDIEDRVRTVDAWLVTSDLVNGAVNTCSNGPATLSGNDCKEALTIHGPVVSGKLLLRRTAGSGTGTASGDAAETISLRPDAFLWARLVAGGAGKAETVSTVELPPRF